jgi:cytochrome bd-type quinol oxidase subunit 2
MFWTVFLAVLAALFAYKYITSLNKEQLSNVANVVKWIIIICILVILILCIIGFIQDNREKILNILMTICYCIWGIFSYWLVMFIPSYIKYRERKKLWLIKKEENFFSTKNDDEWYKTLTEKQKEIENKRSKRAAKRILWGLIAIPILLVIAVVVLLILSYKSD